jgi:hypothetical protein
MVLLRAEVGRCPPVALVVRTSTVVRSRFRLSSSGWPSSSSSLCSRAHLLRYSFRPRFLANGEMWPLRTFQIDQIDSEALNGRPRRASSWTSR